MKKVDMTAFYNTVKYEKKYKLLYVCDRDGNFNILSIANKYAPITLLLCNSQRLELTDEELKKQIFNNSIENKIFKKIETTRQIVKSTKTGKKEDDFTIIDEKVKVNEVFLVRNGVGLTKTFTNKKEALEFCEEIFDKFTKLIK